MKDFKEIPRKGEETPASGGVVPGKMSTEDALTLIHEMQIHQVELQLQNERLRKLQAQNEELQHKYAQLFEAAPVGYLILDRRGIVQEANEMAARQLGIAKAAMMHRPISLFTVREDRYKVHLHLRLAMKTDEPQTGEIRLDVRSGGERAVQMDSVPFMLQDGTWLCRTTLTDITARRQAEAALRDAHDALSLRAGVQNTELLLADGRLEHEMRQRERAESLYRANNALLHLLGRSLSRKEYCDALTEQIREWSGCRCAGFRILDERGGIPYESYAGFSREFWESENALLPGVDSCICTRVAAGKLESQDAPCMTPAGSFRCNDTMEFVGSLSERERKRFRGVCMEHGFRSLCVVPVHCDGKILGLVHVADERPGMVPPEWAEFLESLAPLIGEAVRRFELKEALRQNYETRNTLNGLLSMALEDIGLEEILGKALEMLFATPWLPLEPSGVICLTGRKEAKESRHGAPTASFGPADCAATAPEGCLCPKNGAREFAAVVRRGEVSGESPPESVPRGRALTVPLTSNDGVLGLVHLRLKKGYRLCEGDEAFLGDLANVLASVVRQRRDQEDLVDSGRRLRMLSARLLTAQEEERKRIARELHDSIGSSLSAVKLGLQRAASEVERGGRARDSLPTLISIAQQSIEETRRIMNDLRPGVLDDLGILAAITWFCRNFQEVSGIRVETAVEVDEGKVSERLKTAVFRIMQEGMNNISKHSRAGRAKLTLRTTRAGLELVIEDDGRGCDVEAVRLREEGRGGMGLAGMKERADLSGGTFSITSVEGHGTTVRVFWPRR